MFYVTKESLFCCFPNLFPCEFNVTMVEDHIPRNILLTHSLHKVPCRPLLFSRKFYLQNISTTLFSTVYAWTVHCLSPQTSAHFTCHHFQTRWSSCHVDLFAHIHRCCFCVLCRLYVIWILYYLLSRGIMDICSLEINSHSCEVEQAWLINICHIRRVVL